VINVHFWALAVADTNSQTPCAIPAVGTCEEHGKGQRFRSIKPVTLLLVLFLLVAGPNTGTGVPTAGCLLSSDWSKRFILVLGVQGLLTDNTQRFTGERVHFISR